MLRGTCHNIIISVTVFQVNSKTETRISEGISKSHRITYFKCSVPFGQATDDIKRIFLFKASKHWLEMVAVEPQPESFSPLIFLRRLNYTEMKVFSILIDAKSDFLLCSTRLNL